MASGMRVMNAWLQANQPVAVVRSTPADLSSRLPLIRVSGVGGSQRESVQSARVAVDVFHSSMDLSDQLATDLHRLIFWGLRGVVAGAAVTTVGVEQLPTWVPYPDTNVFLHAARYVLSMRDLTVPFIP